MLISFTKPLYYFLLVITTSLLVFTSSVFPFNYLMVIMHTVVLLVITAAYFMAFPSFAAAKLPWPY